MSLSGTCERWLRDWRTLALALALSILVWRLGDVVSALVLPAVLCACRGILAFVDHVERRMLEDLRGKLERDGPRNDEDRAVLDRLDRLLDGDDLK